MAMCRVSARRRFPPSPPPLTASRRRSLTTKDSLGDQVTIRRDYYLDASKATERLPRAEFFCGVFGSNGHTPSSASFAIPNLDPGQYALVLTNATGGKVPYMVTVVLQKLQNQWKLAGYYPKPSEVSGHDAAWYVQQARKFKQQGELHNAWFYYVLAWEIYSPVDFMSSLQLDKLSAEIQAARPADVPGAQPVPLPAANGRTYNLTQAFAAPDEQGQLSLVVKYQAADVSNTAQAFQDNTAVMKALVAQLSGTAPGLQRNCGSGHHGERSGLRNPAVDERHSLNRRIRRSC